MASKATQQAATQDFIDDMVSFTSTSLEWCAKESEQAARTVGDTIHFLMNDARRISSMSAEAMAVLQEFRSKLKAPSSTLKASDMISALKQLTSEEADVLNLANPVIEALQFQDRVTQQMENMVRMIAVWTAQRAAVPNGPELALNDKLAFGQALLTCTTMPGERDIIRMAIPELPEEDRVESAVIF